MDVNFSDYITDCVRILIIIRSGKKYSYLRLTENKIRIYDYYFRFPFTMREDIAKDIGLEMNVDEHYAFYHWQPDVIRYRQVLNYLLAKGFVIAENINDEKIYVITDKGNTVLDEIKNSYKDKLILLVDVIIPQLKNLSESKICNEIQQKSNLFSRKGWAQNGN